MVQTRIRQAAATDLAEIVALLADDPLGATREALGPPLDPAYAEAFAEIEADPNQHLFIVEQSAGAGARVVGCLQLTVIPGLSRRGARRGQIESVRIAADQRGAGLGDQLIEHAVEESRRRGCALVQLTSDVSRDDARRFYERLGFAATHVGLKRQL